MTPLLDDSRPSGKQNIHLVEFRAGKMVVAGNMVLPDRRKGLVFIYQSADSLMHFCWKDRTTGNVEDYLMIFPDDIEFKHVRQCTTGRVYVLRFKSSSREFFFWLQEPRTDKDEENCWKVNDYLNNPPIPASLRESSGGPASHRGSTAGEQDLRHILGKMNPKQLMQLLNSMGMGSVPSDPELLESVFGQPGNVQYSVAELASFPHTAVRKATLGEATPSLPLSVVASSTSTTQQIKGSSSSGNIISEHRSTSASAASKGGGSHTQLTDLQDVLSSMSGVDLADALTPEVMIAILANPEVQSQLAEFLPEDTSLLKIKDEKCNNTHSPQIQQVLTSFNAALQSGQLGPLMSQFSLGQDVASAATLGDMEAFIRAMQKATKNSEKDEEDSVEH